MKKFLNNKFFSEGMAIFVVILFLLSSAAALTANSNTGSNPINEVTNIGASHSIPDITTQVSSSAISQNAVLKTIVMNNNSLVKGNFVNATSVEGLSDFYDTSNGLLYYADACSGQVLIINTSSKVVEKTIKVGEFPSMISYDSANGYIYLPNENSHNITVINTSSNDVVGSINVGNLPFLSLYVPSTGNIYVSNVCSGNISVISEKSDKVLSSIYLGKNSSPIGMTYDSQNGNLYVAGCTYGNVYAINLTSSKVVGNLSVGKDPFYLTYDNSNSLLYITNPESSNITLVNANTEKIIGNLTSFDEPTYETFGGSTNYMYISNDRTSNVSVLDLASNTILKNINVESSAARGTYNPENNYLYIPTFNYGGISIINGSNNELLGFINFTYSPTASTLDTLNGNIYVANCFQNDVSVINGATNMLEKNINVGSDPRAITYDSMNGYIYVVNQGSNDVSVINSVTNTVIKTIDVQHYPRAIAYDPSNGNIYVADTGSSNVTVISGMTNTVTATIATQTNPCGLAYDSINGNIYVSIEQHYTVSVINTSESKVVANITVGSGPIFITFDSSNGYIYVSNYFSKDVSVINGSTNSVIKSMNVGAHLEGLSYDFENGYIYGASDANGTVVQINGATNSMAGNITVDSYPYTTLFDPFNGNLYVGNKNSGTISIITPADHVKGQYNVTISQIGLSLGTAWYVNLTDGLTSGPLTGTSYTFNLVNSSYAYSIATANKIYHADGGKFKIDGKSTYINITFTKVEYNVSFKEAGFISGLPWGVNIGTSIGITASGNLSAGNEYNLMLTNGTYSYIPYMIEHYFVKNGTIVVHGANITVVISYEKEAHLSIGVDSQTASLSINGANESLLLGEYSSYVKEGYYYITVNEKGYTPYTNLVYLSWNHSYSYNVKLTAIPVYGYLTGVVLPANATVTANGAVIPVMNGYFNTTISPGTYYISVSASGYQGYVTTVKVYENKATSVDVTLQKVTSSVIIQGRLDQVNASLTVNGFVAYVNATGYFEVSVPAGSVTISAVENGYYPFSETLNLSSSTTLKTISLVKEPAPTSTSTSNGTVSTGYNVTVSGIKPANGYVSLNYTANPNGTLIIQLPYNEIRNATITEILESKVYINGVQYKNFTISISSTGSAILTVTHLSGDPTLYWKYSPDASIPKTPQKYSVTFSETGLPSGTTWYVNGTMSGSAVSGSTITFSLTNGTYTFTVTNTTAYYTTVTQFTVKVNGKDVSESVAYNHYSYISGKISPAGATVTINGKSVTLSSTGAFNMTVTAGSYNVVISENGYQTVYDNFTVSSGVTKNVDVTLKAVAQPAKAVSTISNDELFAIIGVVALVVILGAVVLLRKKN
jgi:YVTN family beta-propeller protein